jgi:hypothetical protein
MRCISIASSTILLLVAICAARGQTQTTPADTVHVSDSTKTADTVVATAPQTAAIIDTVVLIPKLDFANIKLFDALTAMARAYNLSLYIDSSVTATSRCVRELLNVHFCYPEEHHLI